MTMPPRATIAPTANDTSIPLMNAARAARARGACGATGSVGHAEGAPERPQNGMRGPASARAGREGSGHVILVAREQHASDDRDTECTSDLEGHGVGGRSDPRVTLRNRPHDGVRRCRQQQPGTETYQEEPGNTSP